MKLTADQTRYLLGTDLLIAPAIEAGADRPPADLAAGAHRPLWSGKERAGGAEAQVEAQVGWPAIFFPAGCPHTAPFAGLGGC